MSPLHSERGLFLFMGRSQILNCLGLDPNDGNPVECCIDLACSTSKNGSCRQYGVIDHGCAGGEWAK